MACFAQVPEWLWAKRAGGTSDESATSIAVDVSGNTYVTGGFKSSSVIFGSDTLTNTNVSLNDIFLAKFDTHGNVIWAKNPAGIGNDYATSIAVDASGNIYVAGYYESPAITFDTTTLSNAGFCDIFLAKYDANGNVLWAKGAEGTFLDYATSVAVDASGNPYITGYFESDTLYIGSDTLIGSGWDNVFLVKYDTNGNVLWSKNPKGTFSDQAYSIAMDTIGNFYVAGYFNSSTIIFGSDTLTSSGGDDIFLVKYNTGGNVIWAKSARTNETYYDIVLPTAVDASGNTFVAGYFNNDTLIFGSDTLMSAGGDDIFLVKYDTGGNVLWAKSAGGTGDDLAYSIAADASGNVYLAGFFKSPTISFGCATISNAGFSDIFLAKYDADGNLLGAKRAGGTDNDYAYSIAIGPLGNTYMAGYFNSTTITFDSISIMSPYMGSYDIFLAKLDTGLTIGVKELFINGENSIIIYPNPASGKVQVQSSKFKIQSLEIYNIQGKLVKQIPRLAESKRADPQSSVPIEIDVSSMAKGIYIVKIQSENGIVNRKLIVQ